ncbi:LysR family transcriptional regulator [Roseibium sp.]|uniref:LysR family transcriptional regulator n=1 Tax=Roseibium sp. TaxID=1936156 RepID=UPI003D0B9212
MRRLDALTLKQLKALSAVTRNGTISGAADELGLTPPAVHSQLKSLEATLGCSLLDRSANGVFVPTAEGRALLSANETAAAALSKALQQIDALKRGLAGTVILGVVSTGKYVAPSFVARLKKIFPKIDIVMSVGNRDATIAALETRRVDLAIMGRPPRYPAVTAYPIGDHPHVLIAPPDHPLARMERASVDRILQENFILREPGSGTRILTMRFLDQLGEGKPFTFTEMESNETIKQAVIAGLGIALISFHAVSEELKYGRLSVIRADNLPIVRKWYLLHRSDEALSGAVETILDYITDNAHEFLDDQEFDRVVSQT